MQDAQAFFDLAALKAGGSLIRVAKAVVPFAGILKILGQVRQRAAALFSQKSPVNIQIVADQRAGNKDRLVLQFQQGLQFGQSLAGVARRHQLDHIKGIIWVVMVV